MSNDQSAWWSWSTHFLWDYVIAGLLTAVTISAIVWAGGPDPTGPIPQGHLASTYLDTAQVIGIINALAITGLGLMQASTGPRMQLLRRTVGRSLTKSWLSSTLTPLGSVAILVSLAWLVRGGIEWTFWPGLVALLLSLVSAIRLGWVLAQVALIDITQSADTPPPTAPNPVKDVDPPEPDGNDDVPRRILNT